MKHHTKLLIPILLAIGFYIVYRMSIVEPFVPKINEMVNKNKRRLRITTEEFTNAGTHYLKILFRKLGFTSMQ